MESIEKFENCFKIEFEDNLLEINCSYKEEIIKVYSKMEKLPRLDKEELNEIASHLYNFYLKLNDNNYKFFNVRKELITDINNKIKNANELISRNYIFSIHDFFEGLDPLFEDVNQEVKKEDEKNIKKYIDKVQIESIPNVEKIIENKRITIIEVFEKTSIEIDAMIENEKHKIEFLVKKNIKEINNNFMNFQQNVQFKIKEMEYKVNKEFNNLGNEIKEYYNKILNSLNNSLLKHKESINFLNTTIETTLYIAYLLTGLTLTVGCSSTLIGCGVSLCATGPIGWIIGIGLICFGYFNFKLFFYSSILSTKLTEFYSNYYYNIVNFISDSREKVLKDFDDRKEIILNKINKGLQGIKLRLYASNDEIYIKKCKEFKRIKKELRAKLLERLKK